MRVKDAVGRFGEQLAADHLEASGLSLLARNWRCARGELDIIARDGRTLVIVEVKTRSSVAFGTPAEAVVPAKAARIRTLAGLWMAEQRSAGRGAPTTPPQPAWWATVRFDVVAVLRRGAGGQPEVSHLRGAF